MSRPNLARFKKRELIWMATHRCKHRMPYIQHPNCYFRERPREERVGILDIEALSLKADWGIVIATCILDLHSNHMFSRVITRKEVMSSSLDRALLIDVIKEMRRYDKLITYFGSNGRFDIPFLRSRAVYHNLDFPGYGEIMIEDLYTVVKTRFKLSRNRLDNAVKFLTGRTTKTQWYGKHWIRAVQGDPRSLAYIKDHCERDVRDTKRLYLKLEKFCAHTNVSI